MLFADDYPFAEVGNVLYCLFTLLDYREVPVFIHHEIGDFGTQGNPILGMCTQQL
jgi:hypothetical protein